MRLESHGQGQGSGGSNNNTETGDRRQETGELLFPSPHLTSPQSLFFPMVVDNASKKAFILEPRLEDDAAGRYR